MDIKETKDVVTFVATLGEGIYESLKDGKVSWADYLNFTPLLGTVLPAIAGIEVVPDEIKDLDVAEMDELKEHFKNEFDIPDDLIEDFVETVLDVAKNMFHMLELFKTWKDRE